MYEGYDPERIGIPPQKTLPERMKAHATGIPISNEHYVHVPCDDYLDYCYDVGKIITMLKAHRDNEGDKCPLCQLEEELEEASAARRIFRGLYEYRLAKCIKLEEELDTYRARHRDAKSNFATIQRLRAKNEELKESLRTQMSIVLEMSIKNEALEDALKEGE